MVNFKGVTPEGRIEGKLGRNPETDQVRTGGFHRMVGGKRAAELTTWIKTDSTMPMWK